MIGSWHRHIISDSKANLSPSSTWNNKWYATSWKCLKHWNTDQSSWPQILISWYHQVNLRIFHEENYHLRWADTVCFNQKSSVLKKGVFWCQGTSQRNQTLWELYGAGVGTYPSLCNNKVSTAQQSVGKAAATRGGKGRCPVHVSPIYIWPNGSKGLPSVHINVNSSIPQ